MPPIDDRPVIAREKTALSRKAMSRPIRQAIDDGLITKEALVLDYGCGRGDDIRLLSGAGYKAAGWDPSFLPDGVRRPAPVVNLGYVVNVIENTDERRNTLTKAWELSTKLLIVSARLSEEARYLASSEEFEDGVLTGAGTFQKFFDQSELRSWIDSSLDAKSVAAAPGVFYVFRDEALEQSYLASRYRQRAAPPRPRLSDVLFEQHHEVLEPLMRFLTDRGRLPDDDELAEAQGIRDVFGSLKRAFAVIRRVTGQDQWDAIQTQRRDDLLIYVALTRFSRRPRFSDLPIELQRDVRAFGPSYTDFCAAADELLFSAGDMAKIKKAARSSNVGKKMPTALYVHVSALAKLPTILRVYEGCARSYVGAVNHANVVKLRIDAPLITYLAYPSFDTDPHPCLIGSLLVPLDASGLQYRDYSRSLNPPILHRKELFLHESHPEYATCAALSERETQAGLYREPSRIGTRAGWQRVMNGDTTAQPIASDDKQSDDACEPA